jgi:hypothetical protein
VIHVGIGVPRLAKTSTIADHTPRPHGWTVSHPVASYVLLAYTLCSVLWAPSVAGADNALT